MKHHCRAVGRVKGEIIEGFHEFDDELKLLWSEITAHQTEKNIYASLYAWMYTLAVLLIVENMRRLSIRTVTTFQSLLCGENFFVSKGSDTYQSCLDITC